MTRAADIWPTYELELEENTFPADYIEGVVRAMSDLSRNTEQAIFAHPGKITHVERI